MTHDQTKTETASKPPKSARRVAREIAMQALYQARIGGNDLAAIEAHMADTPEYAAADRKFCVNLFRGLYGQQSALQEHIQAHLDRPFDDLSPVEACILLTGAYELINFPQTPYRVIINEAIELAKGFGGTDGHKYVNGVLDKLAGRIRADEVAAKLAQRKAKS